ncbi:MAG: hypothetical protein WKG07_14920 [Hymenobacter sp.]
MLKRLRDQGTGILLTSHILGTLTEVADEATVLAAGRVQRHYQAAEFGTLEADLLAALHGEKLGQLDAAAVAWILRIRAWKRWLNSTIRGLQNLRYNPK